MLTPLRLLNSHTYRGSSPFLTSDSFISALIDPIAPLASSPVPRSNSLCSEGHHPLLRQGSPTRRRKKQRKKQRQKQKKNKQLHTCPTSIDTSLF